MKEFTLDLADALLDAAQLYIDDGCHLSTAIGTEEDEYRRYYLEELMAENPNPTSEELAEIEDYAARLMIRVSAMINDSFRYYYGEHAPTELIDC